MTKCKGENRKGQRCGSNPIPGSEFCATHQDQARTVKVADIGNTQISKLEKKKNIKAPSKSSSFKKILSILFIVILPLLITFLGLCFQYFISRPYIIVESIDSQSNNPWESQFAIKNVGWSKAKNINISLTNFVIVDSHHTTFSSRYPGHPGTITGSSIIEGVDLLPQQQYPITPDEFIHFPKGIIVKEAVFTYKFKYRDFLRIVPYENLISYRLFPSENMMVWKPIGPNYQDLKINPQAPVRRPGV